MNTLDSKISLKGELQRKIESIRKHYVYALNHFSEPGAAMLKTSCEESIKVLDHLFAETVRF